MSISDAVEAALLSAHRELEGLLKRRENARDDCAVLIGNSTYGEDRDEQREKALQAAEREFMKAGRRVDMLRAHIASLRSIDSSVQNSIASANDLVKADEATRA
jgi:hypothetical protein